MNLERGPEARAQVGRRATFRSAPHGYRWMTCRGMLKSVAALLTNMGSALCRPPEPRLRPTI